MAGLRWPPPEVSNDQAQTRADVLRQTDVDASHYSDDERSVAADSWSVKSEYGSTLDGDDLRQSDSVDAMAAANFRPTDYSSDKEEPDVDAQSSMLGLQSHWDSAYADELVNFHDNGDVGEIWFGEDVMETVASWTAKICLAVAAGLSDESANGLSVTERGVGDEGFGPERLTDWTVLDIGTGNGVLLHALSRQGFTDLTGTDYSDGAVELARAVSDREGFMNINFMVDDMLDSKLSKTFKLITDKGTLDAIGLHPDGPAHRVIYWKEVTRLLEPGGVLVITSCNSTKNELVEEVNMFNESFRANGTAAKEQKEPASQSWEDGPILQYIDHVRTYPTFRFGGVEGSRVCTVAFLRKG
ncbi:unnamed protein product [Calypogeia fissa]